MFTMARTNSYANNFQIIFKKVSFGYKLKVTFFVNFVLNLSFDKKHILCILCIFLGNNKITSHKKIQLILYAVKKVLQKDLFYDILYDFREKLNFPSHKNGLTTYRML